MLDTLRFELPLGGLGTTYDVHLGLIVKRVVNFLLALIALIINIFSLGVTADWGATSEKKIESRRFRSNAVSLTQNLR